MRLGIFALSASVRPISHFSSFSGVTSSSAFIRLSRAAIWSWIAFRFCRAAGVGNSSAGSSTELKNAKSR